MKKVIILLVAIMLTSCGTTKNYIQIFKTDYEKGKAVKGCVAFEDDNCVITYRLWSSGGTVGFNIYNKTDNDMTINLKKSFFVLNGVAYEYYQNRSISSSSSYGSTVSNYSYPTYLYPNSRNYNVAGVSGISTSSYTTTYNEKSELTIPPKTSINIKEFSITFTRYKNPTLEEFPSDKDNATIKFEENSTPYLFYNLITYTVNNDSIRFENRFFVNEITNYPDGHKSIKTQRTNDNFFIEYEDVY